MIKIKRRPTEKTRQAVDDLKKVKQAGSTYNTESVNRALREVFHGKCYICENKDATSCQIEHLIAHRENKELKYNWEIYSGPVHIVITQNPLSMSQFWTVQKTQWKK